MPPSPKASSAFPISSPTASRSGAATVYGCSSTGSRMERGNLRESIRLRARSLDHGRPARNFVSYISSELLGALAGARIHSDAAQLAANVRLLKRLGDLRVIAVHDRPRRTGRRDHPEPRAHVEIQSLLGQ